MNHVIHNRALQGVAPSIFTKKSALFSLLMNENIGHYRSLPTQNMQSIQHDAPYILPHKLSHHLTLRLQVEGVRSTYSLVAHHVTLALDNDWQSTLLLLEACIYLLN